jgi:type IV secretory pathway TrbD component
MTPPAGPIGGTDNRRRNILIGVVVGVIVLCCCCTVFGLAAWFYGDSVMQWLGGQTSALPLLPQVW